MNRLVRGAVMLAAAAVSWACGGLDTDGIDTTATLVADPGVVYVSNTDSQAVFVEAHNDLGQQLEGDFTVTNVGPGLNVNYDTTFAPRPGVENLPTRVRYFVRASDPMTFVNSSFEVTANGVSVTIPVRITLASIDASFSNPTPNVGDTVTITAPAGVLFTPGSRVTYSGGSARVISVSADSTTLQVVFSASPSGFPIIPTVDSVVVTYLGSQIFNNVPTTGTVTTPALESFILGISTLNATVGQAVTLTIPSPYKATATTTVNVPGAANLLNSISADSTTVVFQAGPNANGIVSLNNLIVSGNAALGNFVLAIDSAAAFTTPVVATVPGTLSTVTPQVGDTVTLTVGAGFKIRPTATVTMTAGVTATPAIITGVAADSSSISFLPAPGSTGVASVNGVLLSSFLALPLTLPTANSITVANTTAYTGTDDPSTAPVFNISNMAVGDTIEFYDLSTNIDQFYGIQVTGASATIAARLSWPAGPDVDILWCNAACSAFVGNFSGATGANPENSTVTFTTGMNNFWVNLYAGAPPAWIRIRFIRTA
jgi:hypothetical protein